MSTHSDPSVITSGSRPTSTEEPGFTLRAVEEADLSALHALEQASFNSDRLSRRRLKHWIQASNRVFIVAEQDGVLLAYGLVLLHRGTRLARLYSIAVSASARGMGIGRALLKALEAGAARQGRLFMRLEVARDNHNAIALYESMGYVSFGIYNNYYEDHQDALRMQKRIRNVEESIHYSPVPWYEQTTEFSCGPASLMMAMAALDPETELKQELELDLWREATTVFMTSGHGGCHPIGLALAAARRGFEAEVVLNQEGPLFVESVRDPNKRHIISLVHDQFVQRAQQHQIAMHYQDVNQDNIRDWLDEGAGVLILISTYRMNSRKAPHWVTVCAMDDHCLYVHDPDPDDDQNQLDCQYLPIARADFDRMSVFGRERLRTAVVIRKKRNA